MNSDDWKKFADDCMARKAWADDHVRLAAVARLLADALKQLEDIGKQIASFHSEYDNEQPGVKRKTD